MSDDAIKVPIEGDSEKLAKLAEGIVTLERHLNTMAGAQDRVTQSSERATTATQGFLDTLQKRGEEVAYIGGLYDSLVSHVEGVADLAAEQQRLGEASANLGLDFDAGAAAAGRFADETEAMAAANRFAAADVHLTQQQLNDLFRVAGSKSVELGVTVGDAARQLTEALVRGREGGLERFGQGLAALAGESHSTQERLAALSGAAQHVTQATDDARDAMARWVDAIDDEKRAAATAFVTEFDRINSIGAAVRGAGNEVTELGTIFRALAATVGEVVARIVGGLRVVGNTARLVVHTLGDALGIEGEGEAATESAADLDSSIDAVVAQDEHADDQRTTEGTVTSQPVRPGGGRRPRDRGAAAAARQEAQRQRQLEDRAIAASFADARRSADARRAIGQLPQAGSGFFEQRFQGGANDNDKEAAERQTTEAAYTSSTEGRRHAEERDREAQRTQRQRDQELARLRTFTEHWEDMHSRQVTASQSAAEAGSMALEKFGGALGKHIELLAQQKESVGDAARGILAETLSSIGHEAIVKGAMEEAEGLASLANPFTAALAPAHFAAGGAFLAAGALASALGGAAAASAPSSRGSASGGASGGQRSGSGGDRLTSGRPTQGDTAGAPVVYQITYNAPVFGRRTGSAADVGEQVHQYDLARQARLRRAA